MGVQIVHHEVPAFGRRIGGEHSLQMGQEIRLGSSLSARRRDDLAAYYVPTENERGCPVADVLELALFELARRQGQIRVLAFQGLHARQFVRAYDPLASRRQRRRGLSVDFTDVGDLRVEPIIAFSRRPQPVADQMRFEIPLLSNRPAWRAEIVSQRPRRSISSAISLPVHWLIGRCAEPSWGDSQASAMIWHSCSGVIVRGLPGRGASVSRSSTANPSSSLSDASSKAIQRSRQRRTISRLTPNRRAIWPLLAPSAAASTIRARSTICWGVRWRLTSRCSSLRSRSVSSTLGGLGPRILDIPPRFR